MPSRITSASWPAADAAGSPVHADVCIVFHVAAGQITRIYEYLDPAAVAVVFDRS